MSNIRKYRNGYRAEVRLNGQRKSKNFKTKRDAQIWINDVEVNGFSANMTVKRLMETYLENIAETHKGYRWERVRIEKLSRMPVAAVRLDRLASKDVSAWRDARLSEVKESCKSGMESAQQYLHLWDGIKPAEQTPHERREKAASRKIQKPHFLTRGD